MAFSGETESIEGRTPSTARFDEPASVALPDRPAKDRDAWLASFPAGSSRMTPPLRRRADGPA